MAAPTTQTPGAETAAEVPPRIVLSDDQCRAVAALLASVSSGESR